MINSNLKWLFNYWLFDRKNYWDMFRWLDRKSVYFVHGKGGIRGSVKGENKFVAHSWEQAAFQCNKPGRRWGSSVSQLWEKLIFHSLSVYHQRLYRVLEKNMYFLWRVNEFSSSKKNYDYIFIKSCKKKIKFKYTLWTYYKYPNRREFLTDNLLSRLCLWYLFFLRP